MSSEGIQLLAGVKLSGDIKKSEDISAIARVGSFLVIGSDEAVGDENYIQLLEEAGPDHYAVHRDILLFVGNEEDGKELDMEGIDVEGDTVYVVGSHCLRRKRVEQDNKYQKNRENLRQEAIDDQKNRAWLYRLTIDAQGRDLGTERISLRDIIKNDGVLKTFSTIPSKENGVDIEGIAARRDWLYLGFRGPVLRGNYVPVMKLRFDEPAETYELLYVNLGGRGIRDIKPVSDGFLLVAGPVGYGPASYQLYHWDGKDAIPGRDREAEDVGKVTLLGEIRPPEGSGAEGIVLLQEGDTAYELIVVYDGVKDGGAQRIRVAKKAPD